MWALAQEGLALVTAGRVEEGMRRLDEASAAAAGGELRDGWDEHRGLHGRAREPARHRRSASSSRARNSQLIARFGILKARRASSNSRA